MTLTLTERRAEFIYEALTLFAWATNTSIVPDHFLPWMEQKPAFKKQFLKMIEQPYQSTSPEELHEIWMQEYFAMGWTFGEKYHRKKRTHPNLVPYIQLSQFERNKDAVFIMLCEIARLYIYEESKELGRYPHPPDGVLVKKTVTSIY